MIELEEAFIRTCALHKVGNKNNSESLKLSQRELAIDDELQVQLGHYFLKPFKTISEAHRFVHQVDIKMNEVFVLCSRIFEGEDFVKASRDIAKHLFQQTRHPAIKSGELFVALMDDIKLDDVVNKALGIFKSERKDNFFKIVDEAKNVELVIDSGINQQKLDKGCIILQHGEADGFMVYTYEQANADTDYWRNDFLSIQPRQDDYFHTKNFMNICKDYITQKLPDDFEVTRAEQIDILNRSVEYFKSNDDFKERDFVNQVFEEPGIIKSFKNFKNNKIEEEALVIEDEFNISPYAVKKQARVFKSVLKLDKNFHVYVHGDRQMIEKGYDEQKGLNFYKIYFKDEH